MQKNKILIFDDDEAILKVLQLVLSTAGYDIRLSKTSHNIIEEVSSFNPDIILMDHNIPEIGGIEAIKLLRENSKFSQIPVLYISASNNIEEYKETSGANDFIKKPFDIDDLETMVSRYLNQ